MMLKELKKNSYKLKRLKVTCFSLFSKVYESHTGKKSKQEARFSFLGRSGGKFEEHFLLYRDVALAIYTLYNYNRD